MTRRRYLLQQCAALVAIFVGAYVSLGTSCDHANTTARLEARTTLPADRIDRHLLVAANAEGGLSSVTIRSELAVELTLPGLEVAEQPYGGTGGAASAATTGAGQAGATDVGVPPRSGDQEWIIDCSINLCDEIYLTLGRAELEGDLDVVLDIAASGRGSCSGDAPEFVEIEVTELD